jgi:plastocyanin
MLMPSWLLVGYAVSLAGAAACIAAPATTAVPTAQASVAIANFTFDPPVLTVAAGTTVTWTNQDDIPHTVTAADGAFRSEALDTDDSYQERFDRPGTFVYFCSLHPHMTGKVVVTAPKG